MKKAPSPTVKLEQLLTHPTAGFGLTTATPLQRAICRSADGLPLGELWDHKEVQDGFGGVKPPETPPAMMGVFCAIRSAKSMIAAARAIAASQNCEVDHLSHGDLIEIPIIAPVKSRAEAVYQHVAGNLMRVPSLRALLVDEPAQGIIPIRHPSGRTVIVRVVALSKHGGSVVSTWLASIIFDEAPLMAGQDDGVRNLSESLGAARGRILPGGQIWLIGSPYAPFGPVYNLDVERFGKPGTDAVVIRAPGPSMNPQHFTPEFCENLKRTDPRRYRTDVLALYAEPEESLFSSVELDDAERKESGDLPHDPEVEYVAAMDAGTRGNAWTLVILGCYGWGGPGGTRPRYRVALNRQWIGSRAAPLSPNDVLQEIAGLCHGYGTDQVLGDQYMLDALRDLAAMHNLALIGLDITSKNRLPMAEHAALQVSLGCLETPKDNVFRSDLLAARKRVTQNGLTLVLPQSGDGRHCDYLPALMLALHQPPEPPAPAMPAGTPPEFATAMSRIDRDNEEAWDGVVRRVTGYS